MLQEVRRLDPSFVFFDARTTAVHVGDESKWSKTVFKSLDSTLTDEAFSAKAR